MHAADGARLDRQADGDEVERCGGHLRVGRRALQANRCKAQRLAIRPTAVHSDRAEQAGLRERVVVELGNVDGRPHPESREGKAACVCVQFQGELLVGVQRRGWQHAKRRCGGEA